MTIAPIVSKSINCPPWEIGNQGVVIACVIFLTWAVSLVWLLVGVRLDELAWWGRAGLVLWQMFLYTGIFITAHDAMHGAVLPHKPELNRVIGTFLLMVYGLFSYQKLLKAHWEHHHQPATDLDPDFHNGRWTDAVTWYLYFMVRYWSWWRFLGLVTIYHICHGLLQVTEGNLVWFWIVPSLLSSVQLFYFGTFLPHRSPRDGVYPDELRTQSSYRPIWWSFLTCYHFGYHREHHQYPQLAWWQLPKTLAFRDSI